jgi:2-haloacid dehalogenase
MKVRLALFDAYGTVFDLNSVVRRETAALGARAAELLALWRRKQLEYSWLRTLMGKHAPFDAVTADALRYALAALGIADTELEKRLLASYERVAPYPDAADAVATLTSAGIACGILSNGTPAMLAKVLEASGLASAFAPVLSVESVGRYKPDGAVYALAESATGVPRAESVFVSANGWDVAGAASFGLDVVWLNRDGAPRENLPGEPVAILTSLSELARFLASTAR